MKPARRQTRQARLASEPERPLSPARAFVVQFRQQADGAGNGFAGRVEHMSSGHAARFESAEELLAFLVDELSALPTNSSEEG